MKNLMKSFLKDESGATAIEYGLIAALVGVAIIGALNTLGGGLTNILNSIAGTLNAAA